MFKMSYTKDPQNDYEAFENQSFGFHFDFGGLDYDQVDNIVVEGIDTKDYPDFCDAYIVSADYDGKPMTDEQLDELNEDGDFQHECIMNDLQ